MPSIQLKVSTKVSEQAELNIKSRLGKAIAVIPGKSESWLMITIEDEVTVYFKGTKDKPAALVQVTIYGNENGDAFDKLTGLICNILGEELNIPADRIYIQYLATHHWGWNGANF